jgi:hypothetical protein
MRRRRRLRWGRVHRRRGRCFDLNSNRQASRGWWARGIERERRAVLRAARPGACIGRVSALNRGDDGVVSAASSPRPAAALTQSLLRARASADGPRRAGGRAGDDGPERLREDLRE